MKVKVISVILALLAVCTSAKAQFYSYGNERGSLKWSEIETPTYRVIYPRGLDSLAHVYAFNLEKVATPVGSSIGYRPNQAFKKKMPVILHPYSTEANGMVSLVPRRMELQTNPEAYSPEILSWTEDLTIHESRHVSQLQYVRTGGGFKILNVIFGEFGGGALSALYCGPNFFEGDAVLAETALSDAGRGRTADFLEYMRVCFAAGDWRDYWQWRYGSQNHFTPDHYKVGYITMAGMRTLYDKPFFTKDYYDRIFAHNGVAFFNFQKTVKEASGLSFKDTFRQIEESLDSTWRAERALRAPFIPSEKISSGGRLFTEYNGLAYDGSSVFAIRRGLAEASSLVSIKPDGKEKKIRNFSSSTSRLRYSPADHRLWWSEYKRDPRWSLESYSSLKYRESDGKVRTFVKGRRLFNPAPSEFGALAATEYLSDGSERVVVFSVETGDEVEAWTAPDGLQIVETAWIDDKLFASAVGREGFGIYAVPGFDCVLGPSKTKIKKLDSHEGLLVFSADLGGVDELYSLDPATRDLRQLTSTPEGAGNFVFADDTLYYTMLEPDGRNVFKTALSDLQDRKTDFADVHHYGMAEKLTAQETTPIQDCFGSPVSDPKDYSKGNHLLKVHSWLPLYCNFDDISNFSFETLYQSAGLGATAYFQNELSSLSGLAGVQMDLKHQCRPSAHVKLTYSGLYPVFELQADYNERLAQTTTFYNRAKKITSETLPIADHPRAYASIKAYIPFSFSSGGWSRGLVPQVKYSMSNDRFCYDDGNGAQTTVPTGTFLTSLRGYTMRGVPSSGMFPRLGIGAEAGYYARPGFTDVFCANAYGFVYGYIPGLMDTHGIKLTASAQKHVSDGILCEAYMKTTPRGFSSATTAYMSSYPLQTKFTVDYALPFAPVNWSWMCPAAYIRNFELTVHADYGLYKASSSSNSLFSVGADLAAHLGNFLWIPYDTRIGVEYNYLGGAGFADLVKSSREGIPHSIGLLFSVDF